MLPSRTRPSSAAGTSITVFTMVASVTPYMLTKTAGSRSGSTSAASRDQLSASPTSTTYRTGERSPSRVSKNGGSTRYSRLGVRLTTVTRCAWISRASRSGSSTSSWSATTSRLPVVRAPRISRTDTSKEKLCAANQLSPPSVARPHGRGPNRASRPRWRTITPLGTPVDPEVYIT